MKIRNVTYVSGALGIFYTGKALHFEKIVNRRKALGAGLDVI